MAAGKDRGRLGPEDWCRAALIAFGEEGEGGFAVERLARRLGVTKGSFYWHFDSRTELVQRALAMWRDVGTREVIAALAAEPDAAARLRALFALSLRDAGEARAEAALQAAAGRGHPVIGPVVAQVNAERVDYLRTLYASLGQSGAWADAAYAAYLGACQLLVGAGTLDGDRREALVAKLQEVFVPW